MVFARKHQINFVRHLRECHLAENGANLADTFQSPDSFCQTSIRGSRGHLAEFSCRPA